MHLARGSGFGVEEMKQEEGEKELGEGGSWAEVQKAAGVANRGTSRRVTSLGFM